MSGTESPAGSEGRKGLQSWAEGSPLGSPQAWPSAAAWDALQGGVGVSGEWGAVGGGGGHLVPPETTGGREEGLIKPNRLGRTQLTQRCQEENLLE